VNSPSGELIGQILGSYDGPVDVSYRSNQKPYLSEPAAWLFLKMLLGCVIQKDPGVESVLSKLHDLLDNMAKLCSKMLWVSTASSMKKV
jgi:hypothetical protein